MFPGNDWPHELLLTTRQKPKLRNAFNNNMSTDLKVSRPQISKIIQSGGFLGSLLSKLAGPLMKVAIRYRKNDPNNSQYFWINTRDLEIETKRNWQVIFDKCRDSSSQKYRK